MQNVNIVPDIKNMARENARAVLSNNQAYLTLPLNEQKEIYLNLVEEKMSDLARQHGLVQPMATSSNSNQNKGPGAEMGFGGYDPGFANSVDAFEDLVDSVDFPQFVSDLLKAVFDANLSVMKQQTDSYIKLMREATKGVADFVKKVKDDDTFAYLADSKSNMFNISMEKQADGSSKLSLTNPEGEAVDMEDNEVKAKIMEAKIAMAKEHRAALREVILMGVTRLVVEKGEVEAKVNFKIDATRKSSKANSNQNINTVTIEQGFDSGLVGKIFGGPSHNVNETNTNINISTSNKDATDNMTAELMGRVNIKFKTDYFKLDNFLSMYGDGGVAALKPATPQQGGAAPPPPPSR